MNLSKLSPTQKAILDILSDGMPHTKPELRKCLPDELAGHGALNTAITRLRAILRPIGHDIVFESRGHRGKDSGTFRHVILLTRASDG